MSKTTEANIAAADLTYEATRWFGWKMVCWMWFWCQDFSSEVGPVKAEFLLVTCQQLCLPTSSSKAAWLLHSNNCLLVLKWHFFETMICDDWCMGFRHSQVLLLKTVLKSAVSVLFGGRLTKTMQQCISGFVYFSFDVDTIFIISTCLSLNLWQNLGLVVTSR